MGADKGGILAQRLSKMIGMPWSTADRMLRNISPILGTSVAGPIATGRRCPCADSGFPYYKIKRIKFATVNKFLSAVSFEYLQFSCYIVFAFPVAITCALTASEFALVMELLMSDTADFAVQSSVNPIESGQLCVQALIKKHMDIDKTPNKDFTSFSYTCRVTICTTSNNIMLQHLSTKQFSQYAGNLCPLLQVNPELIPKNLVQLVCDELGNYIQ